MTGNKRTLPRLKVDLQLIMVLKVHTPVIKDLRFLMPKLCDFLDLKILQSTLLMTTMGIDFHQSFWKAFPPLET